jgi:hypothetical protein
VAAFICTVYMWKLSTKSVSILWCHRPNSGKKTFSRKQKSRDMKLKIKLAKWHHRVNNIFLRSDHIYFVTLESLLWIQPFIRRQMLLKYFYYLSYSQAIYASCKIEGIRAYEISYLFEEIPLGPTLLCGFPFYTFYVFFILLIRYLT